RKQRAKFFKEAEYLPLQTKGEYSDFVFAFARHHEGKWFVTVVPLHVAELCRQQQKEDVLAIDWKDTEIILPRQLKDTAEQLLLDEKMIVEKILPVQQLCRQLPIAVVEIESEENVRNAGILVHVTSLPSPFGIG